MNEFFSNFNPSVFVSHFDFRITRNNSMVNEDVKNTERITTIPYSFRWRVILRVHKMNGFPRPHLNTKCEFFSSKLLQSYSKIIP